MQRSDFFKIFRANRSSPDWARAILEATEGVPEGTLIALFNEALRVGILQPSDGIALLADLRRLNAGMGPAEMPEAKFFVGQSVGPETPSGESPAESQLADSLHAKNQQLESQRASLITVNEVLKRLIAQTKEQIGKLEAMIKSGK